MSGSERSDGFETSRQPEMSSEDAAELEQLRREAAALRVQLQEVASAPVVAAAPAAAGKPKKDEKQNRK